MKTVTRELWFKIGSLNRHVELNQIWRSKNLKKDAHNVLETILVMEFLKYDNFFPKTTDFHNFGSPFVQFFFSLDHGMSRIRIRWYLGRVGGSKTQQLSWNTFWFLNFCNLITFFWFWQLFTSKQSTRMIYWKDKSLRSTPCSNFSNFFLKMTISVISGQIFLLSTEKNVLLFFPKQIPPRCRQQER